MKTVFASREALENEIITELSNGGSIRGLARRLGIARNTVRAIWRNWREKRESPPEEAKKRRSPRHRKLTPFMNDMERILTRYPDLSGVRMFEELQDRGYEGCLSTVRTALREIRPRLRREIVVRFEVEPGRQGQMDWSFYTLDFLKGGRTDVCCFGYVLKYSRKLYVDFCLKRNFQSMICRHQDAFEYFGGVPEECLYDGEKTVLLRWEAGRPVYNPRFISFLTHYGCRPVGCRPGRPQTKGGIETSFKYVENNLLAGRRFIDLEDLRRFTREWLHEKADQRIIAPHRKTVAEVFEEEAARLTPLPPVPDDTAEVVILVGDSEGFICFESNRYSIPYRYVGVLLTVRVREHHINVYSPEMMLVAEHQRLPKSAKQKVLDEYHHGDVTKEYGVKPVRENFLALGESAAAFLEGLQARHPRRAGVMARQVLALKEHYHSDDIAKAMAHAASHSAFEARTITRILKAKFKTRTLESHYREEANQRLQQNLPDITQRALNDYDNLFRGNPSEDPA